MGAQEMAYLHGEVLEEILSRLPVESLARFKCVCKSWYARFRNPYFVSKHMANQSKDNAILLGYCPGRGKVFYFLSNVDDGGDNGHSIEDWDLDINYVLPYRKTLMMYGHCNGIVALSDLDCEIILCNPAIREFRILPKPSCFPEHMRNHLIMKAVGLGYDARTDDYKVVRILTFWRSKNFTPIVEVFSLHANPTWREIKNDLVGVDLWFGNDLEHYFNGFYYWRAENSIMKELMLISFDMASEVFSKAPFPDIKQHTNMVDSTQLGVFNNKFIALFVHPSDVYDACIDVWVTKEFARKESWRKQLTIGPLLGFERPLLFWKDDKELLYQDYFSITRLISYNLTTLKPKNVTLQRGDLREKKEKREAPRSFDATTYMKTLVSVHPRQDIAA